MSIGAESRIQIRMGRFQQKNLTCWATLSSYIPPTIGNNYNRINSRNASHIPPTIGNNYNRIDSRNALACTVLPLFQKISHSRI
jgi:hypothetical protein